MLQRPPYHGHGLYPGPLVVAGGCDSWFMRSTGHGSISTIEPRAPVCPLFRMKHLPEELFHRFGRPTSRTTRALPEINSGATKPKEPLGFTQKRKSGPCPSACSCHGAPLKASLPGFFSHTSSPLFLAHGRTEYLTSHGFYICFLILFDYMYLLNCNLCDIVIV